MILRNTFATLVNVGVLAIGFSCAPAAQAGESQTFRVEAASLEVGPVTAGTVATVEFVFLNDGDREVEIIRAAPT